MRNKLESVAIIGGGPAGLMAAEVLIQGGAQVDIYDAMPSVGRKFLMAGKGGMNITHAEPAESFLSRYGARRAQIQPLLDAFGPEALREWVHGLGITTFVGTSGRVFPADMKAAPLLRAWLHRLRNAGVSFHMRHRWCGWVETSGDDKKMGALCFATAQGERIVHADAVVLALGGGSWGRLGSDGAWVPLLTQLGIPVEPLRPANCGFDVGWSEHFSKKFAGHPAKSVTATFTDAAGNSHRRQGDLMVTANGVEGGLIYALSALLRDEIAATGAAVIYLDLAPGKDLARVIAEIAHPRGSRSMSSHLQSRANIKGVKAGLMRELLPPADFDYPERLAAAIKSLPLRLIAPRPLDEAISSAGGVTFEALDECLMVRAMPGMFCAGEMLDWEAPTGGYLLTACFASGHSAGMGALAWLHASEP
jgi:uncharacterized flavoprotein (TIGR03862 family)